MSRFKRFQSKVFWNQMESRDLGSPLLSPSRIPSTSCGFAMFDCESSGSHPDTTDGDVTVIQTCTIDVTEKSLRCLDEESSFGKDRLMSTFAETNNGTEISSNIAPIEERSFSPVGQDHGSQDSGFSDSDRSDSSGAGRVGLPRRKRRIRKRDRNNKSKTHPRLSVVWKEDEDVPPGPARTSTPKKESGLSRLEQTPRNSSKLPLDADSTEDDSKILQNECLDDFLYACELPEDENPSTSSISKESELSRPSVQETPEDLAALKAWLTNIRTENEEECTSMLQSKSLPKRRVQDMESEELQTRDLKMLTASATAAATKLLVSSNRFDQLYRHGIDTISNLGNKKLERNLIKSIEEAAATILTELGSSPPRRIYHHESLRSVLSQLANIKKIVDRELEIRLDFYIEKIVRGLEESPREGGCAARGALAALTALGLAGPRAGSSIARCSGVRALLTSLISSGRFSSDLRSASLRALASVCCCVEAIDRFVEDGGPEILADILSTKSSPQSEQSEAAALVVQITAPWMDRIGLPYLEPFASRLISSLTLLAENTTCSQTLLLATAAVNHLSRSNKCVASILNSDTIRKLLQCVRKSGSGNVWLMEQVASLIGEVARYPEARSHLASTRASVALVCFLRMRPPGLENAYQRLESTTVETLTRLCVDPEIARQVVAVSGPDCVSLYKITESPSDTETREEGLRCTKSLRLARKKAAEQIDIARADDYAML